MGSDLDELGVSTSLDRTRGLSPGRQAAVGARRLPGAQRRGAAPPRVSRQRSVQSLDALVATDPSAGLGSADADDHWRSLSCCESRDLGAHDRLGGGQAHKRSLVCRRYQGSPCLFLTLQNLRSKMFFLKPSIEKHHGVNMALGRAVKPESAMIVVHDGYPLEVLLQ